MPNLNLEVTTKSQQKNYSSRLKKEKRVDGDCPLHQAVCNNEDHWVLLILTQDALAHKGEKDKSGMQVYRKDSQGYIPIYWAVDKKFSYKTRDESNKNIKILKKLLQYYTINQTDERNKTLLHWAVWNKHLKAVKEILHHLSKKSEKKAFQNFINQEDSDGYTALHYALDRDTNREYNEEIDCEILKNILAYSDNEAIYTADKSNKTLLHWAVWNKHLKGVKEILHHLSKKAEKKVFQNFLNQKDRYGYTALHYAVDRDANRKYSEEIDCKILKNILAYSDSEAIHAVDKNGMTALHWAVKNNNLKAVALILEHTKSSLKSQQAYGAFIKAKTLAGCPAIYWTADAACLKGELARAPSLKIFNLLLHALPIDACGINDQDNEGYTMAHWAAVQGCNDILKVLIQHEANCNIQDKKAVHLCMLP